MGLLHRSYKKEISKRHINKKREAHSSLASLFKASWKLPTNVETSNSELHADTYISIPITRYAYRADTP